MSHSKLPPIVNTAALLATIAELTTALAAETKLADDNAAKAAHYKYALETVLQWANWGMK